MFERINAPKDILAGLIFIAFGASTFVFAHDYRMGTAVQMGPGYFPAAIGLVLAGIGVAALIRGITRKIPDPMERHKLEPLFLVFASLVVFSLLVERTGLFVAAAALIGISCFRRLLTNPLEVLIIYVVLTGFCAVVFVMWFDMQLPLFWWSR